MTELATQMESSAEAMETPPVVSAVGLLKIFHDFWNRPKAKAVNDVDFEVRQGEVIGLLGPNGSGKSTTVKMLLGLLYPTGGRLTVFGKSPRDVSIKNEIGYLPEETYLYKYLTAFETLDFFASLFNLSKIERQKRCDQLLDMVGLSHARNRPVGEFSKGMARRIGLAQAMINDPSLLILDEPTSGLDPLGCREVKDLIRTLKQRGKTVIVTSHLLSDVEDVCDRVIILYGGKIRAQGTLSDLLRIEKKDTITVPSLPPEVMERVLAILRENLNGEEFQLDHPRMSLEEFFLDVVNKARVEHVETSGARSGGKIAEYLAAPETKEDPSKLLNRLAGLEEESKVEEAAGKAAPVEEKKSSALQDLSRDAEAEAAAKRNEEQRRQEREKMADVNDKLASLLSNKKDGE
ncbi:MAG: ATP-binding cassette domain-containing protein [Lentisphaeria bacterium]|nr:ATP-binding cassette domain-containing protein [Lentisphaeria bacterium]